ncbi:MAG: tagaturonate epimerase [Thermotoga sp.]|nr:tagaturonate epimerase [Thermotoga sp.]
MSLKVFKDHFGRGYEVYESSYREKDGLSFFLVKGEEGKVLVISGEKVPEGTLFFKKHQVGGKTFFFCEKNHENLEILRKYFPDLKPTRAGLKASFGTGDRLGITTPAHVRALRGSGLFPVFAQQSVRENERTGRTWRDVLDDATWGVFQEGYTEGFGADADHVKNPEDLVAAAKEGFSMFTIDPSDHVRNLSKLSEREKNEMFEEILKKERIDRIYLGKKYTVLGERLEFDEKNLRDAALVYYDAIAHVDMMYQILKDR